MQRRDPMIDIHIRISRRLVLVLVFVFVVLPIVWVMLQTLGGHSSGGIHVDPVTTTGKP
jgi:hypothetical protein